MTEDEVKSAAAEYRAGKTVRALAVEWGVSYGTMYTRLSEADVEFRPRGSRGVPMVPVVHRPRIRSVK